ncbi:OmpA family protein [Algiphilus sp.]|uniref:OmpA family protein n=1 Tax=Algiphilus sp. TaxID=1872431 RepID=UPI003B528CA6
MYRTFQWATAVALSTAVCAAAAANTNDSDMPYVQGLGTFTIVDNDRTWDDDFGFQVGFGLPLEWENTALELSIFSGRFERDIDGDDDYHAGITLDLVRDFGGISFLSRSDIVPFALAGVGAVRDDVQGDHDVRPMANIGAGARMGLPWLGMDLRSEFRVIGQHESLSAPGEDWLIDYRFLVGLQLPLTPFFAAPSDPPAGPLPDEEECEVAVVDPVTGRTDCRADSDDDGVDDTRDACPSTAAGVTVDEEGCPLMADSGQDSDSDGVMDASDACPDTYPGVTVNTDGCAEPQPLVIPKLTFEFDTARLTPDARMVVDDITLMLQGQPELTVEIIGHTDSRGPDAYNQKLSEERAIAVRDRLVAQGIDDTRLSLTGRGESQPVASNDTEQGRAANRRVAFWLYID